MPILQGTGMWGKVEKWELLGQNLGVDIQDGKNHGGIKDLIAISKLKDLCKSGERENICNGMEARGQSMAEMDTSGLRLLRVRMVKQFSGTNYTKTAINYKLRRLKREG